MNLNTNIKTHLHATVGQRTQNRWSILAICLIMVLPLLAACGGGSSTATATTGTSTSTSTSTTPTSASGGTTTPTATEPTGSAATATTGGGTATATSSGTGQNTTSPTATTGGQGGGTSPEATYLDDRSTAESVIRSYYNAINSKEYARAYSYWESGATDLPPFDQFQQGYADTASVELTIGQISAGAAAGNLYYSVPVVLRTATTNGGAQTFSGCYVLHLGQPANQAEPPFESMAVQSAQIAQADNSADPTDLLKNACQSRGMGQPVEATPAPDPADISASRYLDDRSDAVQVIRSYYNAINSKQYARAYSYWEENAAGLPPFDQFQQGYAKTDSVQLTTGTVTSDAGAGQRYYSVPTTIVAKTTDGGSQTFVGCYKLHLAEPHIQAAPPFHPTAIQSATVKQAESGANTAQLMSQACQQ